MKSKKTVEEWKPMLQPVLESKTTEFHLLGYSKATSEDLWNCLVKKVWKDKEEKRLYEVVQDIFHLDSGTYMNYLTIDAYQNDDLMASIAALSGKNVDEK